MQNKQNETQEKTFRVYKTICEMMLDRGYENPAVALLDEINREGSKEQIIEKWEKADSNSAISEQGLRITPAIFLGNNKACMVVFRNNLYPLNKTQFQNYLQELAQVQNDKEIEKNTLMIVLPYSLEQDKQGKLINKKDDTMKIIEEIRSDPLASVRIEFFTEEDLVFNVTRHELVPKHIPLTLQEQSELLKKYKINKNQLPKILPKDPVTRYFGLKHGDIFKIIRDSETAGKYVTYRVVV